MVNLEVNNKQIKARRGDTILSALLENGIHVPTLCHLPELEASGACRMCVVEVEGKEFLIPSCAHPVEENMKILTHSPRVIRARKTLTELLLANHPDDCLFCPRNENCELQQLSASLNINERRFPGSKGRSKLDQSCVSMVRDPGKCILCGRCVRSCEEIVGNATFDFLRRGDKTSVGTCFNKPLNLSNCVFCGQCLLVCPTAALREKDNVQYVMEALHNPELHTVIQVDPGVLITLCEEFGSKAGKTMNGALTHVLHKLGFDKVFDTGLGNDLFIKEIMFELADRIEKGTSLPLIMGNCPGWVKFAEQNFSDIFSLFSKLKSPQQLLGNLIKRHYSETAEISPEHIFSVSVTTCPAKKYEAQREEMLEGAFPEVDAVLTSRELARLIRLNGLDLRQGGHEHMDAPYDRRSSAASLMCASGGTAEAVLRTYANYHKQADSFPGKITKLRGSKDRKEFKIEINNIEIGVAVANGLKAARQMIGEIQKGRTDLHLIEVMVCPGGCINGGGQPFYHDPETLALRVRALHESDEKDPINIPDKNIMLNRIYETYLLKDDQNTEYSNLYHDMKTRTVLL
ncbi:MAG: [Fe-Fe] hydrogenase large subunit C-terminal domain-containing protein [Bacteroidota bacterium]